MKRIKQWGLVMVLCSLAACQYLPPVPQMSVIDTKAKSPDELKPTIDPIDSGEAQPSVVRSIKRLRITSASSDLSQSYHEREIARGAMGRIWLVDGQRVVDSAGTISDISVYSDSGSYVYAVYKPQLGQLNDGYHHHELKLVEPNGGTKVIGDFATGQEGVRSVFRVNVDGQDVVGEQAMLTSRGLLLTRDNGTVISFISQGQPAKTWVLPSGYQAEPLRALHYDVEVARHLIIYRHKDAYKIYGVLPSTNMQVYDVSFFNLDTGKITATAKDVVTDADNGDALQKSLDAYIVLRNTDSGPIAVTAENQFKQTIARNLATLQKIILVSTDSKVSHSFSAGIETRPAGGIAPAGKMWVQFGPGNGDMANKTISDLEGWMKGLAHR